MAEPTELQTLLDCVEEALASWQWHPVEEYGTSEALIPTRIMLQMNAAYEAYCQSLELTGV